MKPSASSSSPVFCAAINMAVHGSLPNSAATSEGVLANSKAMIGPRPPSGPHEAIPGMRPNDEEQMNATIPAAAHPLQALRGIIRPSCLFGLLRLLGGLGRGDRFDHDALGFLGIAPLADTNPLLGLQVLVVLEEMLDLREHDRGQ